LPKYETSHTFIKSSSKIDNLFDFISNLGGNFGLFIGISFLSFAEFIELFIEIILIVFKRSNSLLSSNV
jgi:hypothetical protein